jgi:hypothetical protein
MKAQRGSGHRSFIAAKKRNLQSFTGTSHQPETLSIPSAWSRLLPYPAQLQQTDRPATHRKGSEDPGRARNPWSVDGRRAALALLTFNPKLL